VPLSSTYKLVKSLPLIITTHPRPEPTIPLKVSAVVLTIRDCVLLTAVTVYVVCVTE
jgi:hypothetical protein